MSDHEIVERPFFHLFGDAIEFMLLAEQQTAGSPTEGLFARSSIIHAAFTLESAANCCLREHPYPPRLLEKCDSLPLVEKYEFVLATISNGMPIDRGRKDVQYVEELVSIRNRYVHPKAKSGALIPEAFQEGFLAYNGGAHKMIGISQRPIQWKAADARKAITAVIEFLDVFLVDWCELSEARIEKLLVSSATFDTELLGHGKGQGFGLMCDMRAAELLGQTAGLARRHPLSASAAARGPSGIAAWIDDTLQAAIQAQKVSGKLAQLKEALLACRTAPSPERQRAHELDVTDATKSDHDRPELSAKWGPRC